MATSCSLLNTTIPLMAKKSSIPKTRGLILRNGRVELETTAASSLKTFSQLNKVFEDKESGVICYRDENGQLICEGYDEGPRFTTWQNPQRIINRQARRCRVGRRRHEVNGHN